MTVTKRAKEYIKSRGLTVKLVTQKMGVSRQAFEHYGTKYDPTLSTLQKIANAMTELGAETKVVDLVPIYHWKGE